MIRLNCPHNPKVPFTILLTKHVLMSFWQATLHHITIMFKNIISKSNRDQFIEESDISFCSGEEADAKTIQHVINHNLGKQVCHSGNCRMRYDNVWSHWSCEIQKFQPFSHGIWSGTKWYFLKLWTSRAKSKKSHCFLPCVCLMWHGLEFLQNCQEKLRILCYGKRRGFNL